ncbi:MAG: phosphate ABC transporter permease PstA [Spirochaetaceae bacterium]|jgi:phosphate transport system permease protein|nr:phosphate ABC transporter permease PstA [Spirochaetaceae bacterium]
MQRIKFSGFARLQKLDISKPSFKLSENLLRWAVWLAAGASGAVFLYIAGFILVKGIPHIRPGLFAPVYTSENASLLPALVSTIIVTLLSLAIAAPLGIFAAVWLVEYTRRGAMRRTKPVLRVRTRKRKKIGAYIYAFASPFAVLKGRLAGIVDKLAALVRITAETLAGIPSVVYGLFGMLFFVNFLGMGFSVIAGSLTLSLMILPLVLRSTEEALRSVPDDWRLGSFSLGAGRLRTVFYVVLPAAAPGILAGVILAIGRIAGETAALIYTAGTVAQVPSNPLQSARTLSVHVYALSSEGLHTGEAYAAAAVLLFLVIGINTVAGALAKTVGR